LSACFILIYSNMGSSEANSHGSRFLDGVDWSLTNFLVQVPDPAVPSPAGRGGIPEKFDYMWTNIWASSAEYETVMATWSQEGQAVQAAFDAVVTCSAELTFDLTPLMSASE
jgi:hypothetical protein